MSTSRAFCFHRRGWFPSHRPRISRLSRSFRATSNRTRFHLHPPDGRLKVGGLVARPSVFTLEQLKAMPRMDMRVRHYCVNGWSAVAAWHGVRLSEIARTVGADPRAPYVEFRSFDAGYWSSWDRASALHPQTILAYGMYGHPLHPDHGAPLRLYSAVKLGYKMVKYLTEINFLSYCTGGTVENNGSEWFAGV